MSYDEILVKLRERLEELKIEQAHIIAMIPKDQRESTLIDPVTSSHDTPRRWSAARRKQQSQRMKRLHREGKLRR